MRDSISILCISFFAAALSACSNSSAGSPGSVGSGVGGSSAPSGSTTGSPSASSSTSGGVGGAASTSGSGGGAAGCDANADCAFGTTCSGHSCIACAPGICVDGKNKLGDACDGKDHVTCGIGADGCPAETAHDTCSDDCDPMVAACCGMTGQACCGATMGCAMFNHCSADKCVSSCDENACTDQGVLSGVICTDGMTQALCDNTFTPACPMVVNAQTCSAGCDAATGTCGGCAVNECLTDWTFGAAPILCTMNSSAVQCGLDAQGCKVVVTTTHCDNGCFFPNGCK